VSALSPFGAAVERSIRAGDPPSPPVIARMAAAHTGTLGTVGRDGAATHLVDRLVGLGPLSGPAADLSVTDLLVNGDGSVWVDRGTGVERAAVRVPADDLRGLAVRLAGVAGRRLDDAQPWVDGVLPGGVRLHAVLPPLSEGGPHLSLRFARHRPAGLDALVALSALTAETAAVLRALVVDRVSLAVTGGTGAGKTTVLAALLAECPADERLVVVEDVRELDPCHPHVVRLQGRSPNVEGRGGVTLVDLVRQALRMRPDRLVVGEVRGPEVRELLAALNTGHEGGMSTLHANGPEELPARIEALAALAGMPRSAVHAQLRQALHAVVHVGRDGAGRRRVRAVGVLGPDPADPGHVRVEVALRCGAGVPARGPAWDRLVALAPSAGTTATGDAGAPGARPAGRDGEVGATPGW
jgi:pilus assembly protein CpaF